MIDDEARFDEVEDATSDLDTGASPKPFKQKPIKSKPEPEKSGGHGG